MAGSVTDQAGCSPGSRWRHPIPVSTGCLHHLRDCPTAFAFLPFALVVFSRAIIPHDGRSSGWLVFISPGGGSALQPAAPAPPRRSRRSGGCRSPTGWWRLRLRLKEPGRGRTTASKDPEPNCGTPLPLRRRPPGSDTACGQRAGAKHGQRACKTRTEIRQRAGSAGKSQAGPLGDHGQKLCGTKPGSAGPWARPSRAAWQHRARGCVESPNAARVGSPLAGGVRKLGSEPCTPLPAPLCPPHLCPSTLPGVDSLCPVARALLSPGGPGYGGEGLTTRLVPPPRELLPGWRRMLDTRGTRGS